MKVVVISLRDQSGIPAQDHSSIIQDKSDASDQLLFESGDRGEVGEGPEDVRQARIMISNGPDLGVFQQCLKHYAVVSERVCATSDDIRRRKLVKVCAQRRKD